MKIITLLSTLFLFHFSFGQTTVNSKAYGALQFVELDHGIAQVVEGTTDQINAPTGSHGWLKDLVITKVTDSVQAIKKANFGVVYQVNAKDTMDIAVVIEWIYPQVVTNEKGEQFKSIKYTTRRPTNIPSASSYSLDEP
jgi:hypothetical protein